ncbi:alanyl-tRNA editing protein [Ornithinibacillus halophilus]|uniref:Alanine--tRNA ligase n=1 Tax=Ornithinibacillus halophilus TaxID=930117 RepID=A0A1M5FPM2_9BACI|nr:DHHA1 domain-containing protein [Ornithinibacillus halophilus]SHF93490.1 alanyl-tRNA synthetase [Ornithinibacillus halophilus]
MFTEKLYYKDSYIRSFTATVLKSEMEDDGRYFVLLDKTAFYPTGGGQPHDIGKLNNIEVYDVQEVEGEIRHYVEQPIELHKKCEGVINWDIRFDHMQQHAGQHILSAAFDDHFNYQTVSFHLGKEICSIDINVDSLSADKADKVEQIANNIILENRSIDTKWVTQEELSNYRLRKSISVSENIRLVIIPDFDYNGCGGTHPTSTGQVGLIKILHWEKQKKQTRVYFVCGNRVLRQLQNKHHVVQDLTTKLSVPQEKLVEKTEGILVQNKNLEKNINELNNQILEFEAIQLTNQIEIHDDIKIIKMAFQDKTMAELQVLARTLIGKRNDLLVLLVSDYDNKLQLVCARSESIEINVNQLLKQTLPLINGRGGGKENFAQGGGEKVISAEQLLLELIHKIKVGI